ncbi:ATP-dependent exoDNAse (exonuclease V) alpha subunit - helicase superfamily I member [Dissulfuribacter thermophilus]|uniref:ATP-dependent exoDNAse (Exonuclease V) alpha subunit-helicase superfamily I member n=1 Tax=Dissulfuribacter thermophilus TaxID=1156395 RepID=A0A1B9F336_9BACT|nr:DUF3108 domain-containing protein [Dissulfuribacter thermophilus]OCC14346.1 ATP-dependent exoDNAse (exonuclease V) alpha subunit - helicase superfamily I member [Dissulfuribacter thermophilus]
MKNFLTALKLRQSSFILKLVPVSARMAPSILLIWPDGCSSVGRGPDNKADGVPYKHLQNYVVLLIILIGLFVPSILNASTTTTKTITSPPEFERLKYRISWQGLLKVGEGTISLQHKTKSYLLEMTAKSIRAFDLFFKVRDYFKSVVPEDFSSFSIYEKRIREGRYKRHDLVYYSPQEEKVTYKKNSEPMPELHASPPVFDPFSILFAYRFTCDKNHESCTLSATDGKHLDKVIIKKIKREKLEVPFGSFDSIKVQPIWERMHGVFRKKKGGHIYVWFDSRPPFIPLKMEAEIFIGKVVAVLIDYESH